MTKTTPTNPPGESASESAGTEVALRNGTGLVVVSDDFAERYPAIAPDPDTLELLDANLGNENLGVQNFKRVKVPSSESSSFMVPTLGDEVAVKELTGIMVAWKARRSMWIKDNPDGSSPDCYSLDNRRPVPLGLYGSMGENAAQNPTGLCANCPLSQMGSDPKGAGAKCREQRLIFLATPNALFPLVINVPRTSIANVTGFMMDLMSERMRFSDIEVGFTLAKATSKAGQVYNKIVPRLVRRLDDGEKTASADYGKVIKGMVEQVAATFDAEAPATGEGISVGEPQP